MGEVSPQRTGRSRPLGLVVLYLLASGCVGDGTAERRDPIELRVLEDWELLVEQPTDGFADTVARNAEDMGDVAGGGSALVGCVAGGVSLAAISQGQGGEAGCALGGLALYPVGYVVGFGTGAVVGSVQGVVNLFADADEEIDMHALSAVLASATPRDDLTDALLARSERLTLTRASRRLTLTITRFQLTTTTSARPTSRLRLKVTGDLTDLKSGKRLSRGTWRYVSEATSTAALADNGARAMWAELDESWRKLAQDIVDDLLD
jgi:hypothetical protein